MRAAVAEPQQIPVAPARDISSGLARTSLCSLVVVIVVGQRFALPLGGQVLPVTLLAAYAVGVLLLCRGVLMLDRLRLELFVLAAGACATAAYVGLWGAEQAPVSLPSMVLLFVVYGLWLLRRRGPYAEVNESVLRAYTRTMLVLSGLGVLQMAGQYTGAWRYKDYIGSWVPPTFLLQDYNTSAPTAYLSSIYRGNAFVFLEPSFLSQYCALAILIALVRRAPAWQLLVLAAGLASAVSGTGFLLLAAGLLVVVVRRRSAIRPSYIAVGIVAAGVLLATPFADGLLGRVGEFGKSGTSASLRFVQPYTETVRGLDEAPSRYYVGAGPGTSERLLLSNRGASIGQAVTYTTAPKLIFEYGLIAGGLFLLFLVVALFRGAPVPVVPAALFVMTWILSGALLQAHTAVLVWLLTVVWGHREGPRPSTGSDGPTRSA
jgi:hypothetical protein